METVCSGQTAMMLHNYRSKNPAELQTEKIQPAVSEMTVLTNGQTHMGLIGK